LSSDELGPSAQARFLKPLRQGCILTLPPEISPSPRQPSAGRGLGRGASTGLQTWAAVAFRQGGLLSPTLSSQGGEGGPVVGWWQCQAALSSASAVHVARPR